MRSIGVLFKDGGHRPPMLSPQAGRGEDIERVALHHELFMTTPLETRDLTIRFGGHVAVNSVSCTFRPGELTAIVGPNGAGKTTYFNLISGQLRPSDGSILLDGADITQLSAPLRTRAGLGRAFQLTNLFPNLSVEENVRLAVQSESGVHYEMLRPWTTRRDLIARADAILDKVALGGRRSVPVTALSHGDQRKLEVALMMALEPKVFMFDEPTAGMSIDDVPVVLNLIAQLKQDAGKIILLVEHKMDVVRSLADRIIVLHNGQLVADGKPADVIASPIVQEASLGVAPGKSGLLPLAGVHTHIGRYHILHGIDFAVPEGQTTMLLGRNGAGKTTTLRTIMGLWQASAGRISLDGQAIEHSATPDIARLGVGYVPESMAVFSDLTVKENLVLAARDGPLDDTRLEWIFGFFPALRRFWLSRAGLLSGGQKQMLSIARAIVEPRKLLLIDEPTKGLAPAIVVALIECFAEVKRRGATILLVEQNFHAARELGDKVLVMDNGKIVHRGEMAALASDTALQERLLGLSLEAHQ